MALPAPSDGSAALVTGASSGIGRELARGLARRGHQLILVARTESKLRALAEELDVRAEVVPADLADAASRDELARRVAELGLDVEVLVNCAGFGTYEDFVDADRDRLLSEVRLDVEAVVDLMARYLPAMTKRGQGAVINLSSTAGLQPLPHNALYSGVKAGVLLLSEAVNAEVRKQGVTVTAVLPGPVRTEFQERNDAAFAERLPKFAWVAPEKVAEYALRAAERGRRSVIPGSPLVKLMFGPNRFFPKRMVIAVSDRIMRA